MRIRFKTSQTNVDWPTLRETWQLGDTLKVFDSGWIFDHFVALGDEHRQRILLLFEPGDRLTVGQIAEVSTLSRPTVSHHLKILREAGVLQSRKEGKEVYFWIDKEFLVDAMQTVLDYIRHNA